MTLKIELFCATLVQEGKSVRFDLQHELINFYSLLILNKL